MAKPFFWGPGGAQMTPEQIAAEKKVANALMLRGMDYSPVQSWTQGAARVAQALMGGLDWRMADEARKRNTARDKELLTNLLGGGATPAASAPAPASSAAPAGGFGDAIASIESGGKYDALGPVIPKTGDRAYGKYQIMGANVPAWTKAHLGQEMTPQAFLASPEAQDAVFKAQFGQYVNKYGPEGAARAWFAGEGGMNNPNARDVLGTSVADYAKKFTTAMGGTAAQPAAAVPQPAQAAPAGPNVAAIVAAMSDPAASDTTKAIGKLLLQQRLQGDNIQTIDLGNAVGVMDKRGNLLRQIPKGEPNKGATFGVIGKDEFGNERYGWTDPRTQSVIPYQPSQAGQPAASQPMMPEAAPQPIPPAPPGMNPKVWRDTVTKQMAERAVTQPEKEKQARATADIVTTDIDRAIKTIDSAMLPTTGMAGGLLSNIGGTAARDLAGLLDTVKANAGFDTLAKMRAASPTGGALGSITERELALLQSTIGNLEQSQTEAQLKDNLRRVKNTYLDIIHGPGNGPARERLSFEGQEEGWQDLGGGVRIREKR